MEERHERLRKLLLDPSNDDEHSRLLWMWIKQGKVATLREFRTLLRQKWHQGYDRGVHHRISPPAEGKTKEVTHWAPMPGGDDGRLCRCGCGEVGWCANG